MNYNNNYWNKQKIVDCEWIYSTITALNVLYTQ